MLAAGTAQDVRRSVGNLVASITDRRRVILSAGGFAPGAFDDGKIQAFIEAVAAAR